MSGRSLALGQYYPGASAVHLLDPRVKILLVFAIVTVFFVLDDLPVLLMGAFLVAALERLSRLPFGWVARGLKPLAFIIVFTFLIHLFSTPGGQSMALGPLTLTSTGLKQGLFYSLRLVLVILLSSFITLTTTPVKLTDAFESLLAPLKKINLPTSEFALMVTIALRFIPTILGEAEIIIKAQKARGVDFDTRNFFSRTKSFVPVLIPLFVSAFRRADQLALAMEARGYRSGANRTHLHELQITLVDAAWMLGGLATVLAMAAVAWWF